MRKQVIIMLGMLLIIPMLAISSTLTTTAQVSEAEAKQIFENIGCTSCHMGQPLQPGASWDLIVQFMQDWSQKYASIDEAIANEVTYYGGKKFQSFDELMAQMAQNVGRTPDDPEIQKLSEFFKSFWQQDATPTEEQPQQEEQAPAEQQQEQPAAEQPAQEQQEQPTGTMSFGQIVGIAVVLIIILAGIAYVLAKK